jgi:hypothetical protein
LPADAPELNPVEDLGGLWKHPALPTFDPRDFGPRSSQARCARRRLRRRPALLRSCSPQAALTL